MKICQNPDCSNPFNVSGNRFCVGCGANNFGDLLRNRYRVKRLLGTGGFGRTYEAQDLDRLDAACVVKQFIRESQGTTARAKAAQLFRQEAKRLFELGENHSQIPRLVAYFEQGTCMYLVQEFIDGDNLYQELQREAFSETQIWQVLTDLLPVLEFIHQRQVIHRDIKPENIIRRASDGKLVLIDFGGAKQVTQNNLAQKGTGIYTLGYAAAEQMAGYACAASDLYALGATCVRLLTGCLVKQDEHGNVYDPIYDPINGRWLWREYLATVNITVSHKLTRILNKLLKHFVRERYQSAADVLLDVKDILLYDATPFNIPNATSVSLSGKDEISLLHNFQFDTITVDKYANIVNRDRLSAEYFVQELDNGINLEMVYLCGGTFMMGSPESQGYDSEHPQHFVTIKPLFMSKFAITQAQWLAVAKLPQVKHSLNPEPSYFKGDSHPVEQISWHEAVEFCVRLSNYTGKEYRLPSEAEWEYACRANTITPFHFGDTITSDLVNHDGNYTYGLAPKGKYRQGTTPVGKFPPNALGLYDMHGNVWEWCADSWHDSYHNAPCDGRVWHEGGEKMRVMRGGSWFNVPRFCRSALRYKGESTLRDVFIGLRVVSDAK
ncbi:bifunctional serine/threonine-protein kinase/formylglycine-generating enzyme family protein [Rivularia sp. UHCC 0363]|uniref:bifunctional serine/threonine-protein kinase/formylglycine-generating enzyme family protein n=1 Tax=Rivularia sp. UHCC 0363 TaxID=3110244 RepID=UPI002B214753|nr:bifunctional serine/threonine-protein kinase/formylglycine-generating enzyme family protein [Rivularia sp. UHCC 0363]MEA5594667.1 bifunctional serine/threonine-protein kinase/formylglycine-generating enzyme family protein [Rivularia sp. UHCC 0363]